MFNFYFNTFLIMFESMLHQCMNNAWCIICPRVYIFNKLKIIRKKNFMSLTTKIAMSTDTGVIWHKLVLWLPYIKYGVSPVISCSCDTLIGENLSHWCAVYSPWAALNPWDFSLSFGHTEYVWLWKTLLKCGLWK